MKLLSVFLIAVFISIANSGYTQDAQEIIKKVQSNYKGIKDAKASFSHTGKRNSESGTIYIQKENKYRIETKGQVLDRWCIGARCKK